MDVSEAAKLLSTPKDELDKPPVNDVERQDALVSHDATPKTEAVKRETQSSDTEAELPKFKVKVDGEEIEVDEMELKKGYSRESHYQKKAKDLAKEREAFQEKESKLDSMLSDAELLINDKRKRLQSDDLKELRDYDPEAYLKEVEKLESEISKFDEMKSKRQSELKAKEEKLLAKEREMLFETFPHWKDEAMMSKEAQESFEALREIGFKDDELNNITDYRMFVLADIVKKFNAIDKADLDAKEVKEKPKSVSPNASQNKDPNSSTKKDAYGRFLKTGKVADAVNYLTI